MQRGVPSARGDRTPRPCPACGAALRGSHREYAGAGMSALVMRCPACGHTVRAAARDGADRPPTGRSRKHRSVDEGPPSNPVIDPEVARRLLDELGA